LPRSCSQRWRWCPAARTARFPSIEEWVKVDVKGWTLAQFIDEAQYQLLLGEAKRELRRHVRRDGGVEFEATAVVASAAKTVTL
jgi:hypothetical protein